MITRHRVLLAGATDLRVEHPLSRVQAAASLTGTMPRVRVSEINASVPETPVFILQLCDRAMLNAEARYKILRCCKRRTSTSRSLKIFRRLRAEARQGAQALS
jgi:hypothetical protein